jgi:hypothetical protein
MASLLNRMLGLEVGDIIEGFVIGKPIEILKDCECYTLAPGQLVLDCRGNEPKCAIVFPIGVRQIAIKPNFMAYWSKVTDIKATYNNRVVQVKARAFEEIREIESEMKGEVDELTNRFCGKRQRRS